MRRTHEPLTYAVVAVLVGIGVVMVFSSSAILAEEQLGDQFFYLKKQVLFVLLGVLAVLVARRVPASALRKLAYPLAIFNLILLIAIFVPGVGKRAGGALRWLRVGPFSFQPSELAKLSIIVLLAASLARKEDRVREFKIGFLPHIIMVAPFILLTLAQPDLGTALFLVLTAGFMMYFGGVRLAHLASAVLLAVPCVAFEVMKDPNRMKRLLAFADPFKDPSGYGYQIIHSWYGFASGGLYGRGLAAGTQKLFFLPEIHTDFIMSLVAEELGFVFGVVPVILLFLVLMYIGLSTAMNGPDRFTRLLAAGITASLTLQALINLGVASGALPTKGLPLPFVSYGGSSLLVSMTMVGVLAGVMRTRKGGP